MPNTKSSRSNRNRRDKRGKFNWLDQVKADDELPSSAFLVASSCRDSTPNLAGLLEIHRDPRQGNRAQRTQHRQDHAATGAA
jgi:hypothetical protein